MPTSRSANLHTLPTLRQRTSHLKTQDAVKRSQVTDWTGIGTTRKKQIILHFNVQTKWVSISGVFATSRHRSDDDALSENGCFWTKLDWTTEYKEGFNSEQTFYTKLSRPQKYFGMRKCKNTLRRCFYKDDCFTVFLFLFFLSSSPVLWLDVFSVQIQLGQ